MTGSMLLYNEAGSSTTYRVRIALNLKKQEYELKTLDIDQQHHQSTEYLELKPQGLIPLLVHATNDGDVKLTQSVAIMEYLEDILPHQGTRLLPDSPVARARVRSLALHIACEMQPLNNTRVTKHIKKELQGDPETLRSWQIHWAETGFTGLEKELQSPETGSFCHGDQPTMADCCLVPQVALGVLLVTCCHCHTLAHARADSGDFMWFTHCPVFWQVFRAALQK